jgi:hypothetical protein
MKAKLLSTALATLFALAACGPAGDQEIELEANLPGSDRDAHGCIGSAGYEWSALVGECIRVWERGIALMNMQDSDDTSGAYLVKGEDDEKLELFYGGAAPVLLSKSGENEWHDAAGEFLVRLEPPSMYAVYDKEGASLYFEDRSDVNSAPVPAEDETDDDLLTEYGILSSIEDGAYPFYAANMEFPKREMVIAFTLNIEDLQIEPAALMALEGQYVSIDYVSKLDKMVVEMELESGFLMGSENREQLRDYKIERGIMGGAEITMGDLPGSFYLEDAENNKVFFEEYITEEMMAGLGRDVIVYYQVRGQNIIKKITMPEE